MKNLNTNTVSADALLILLASQLAIGASGIFARFAMHAAGPLMVSALRLSIASLVLIVLSCRKRERETITRKHEFLFAICGMALAAHFGAWMASLGYISIASATLIISTSTLWTSLYDMVALKRRPTSKYLVGLAISAAGVIMFVASTAAGGNNVNAWGEIISALGGIVFAIYLIAIRSVTTQYSTLTIITRTYSWSAVFLCLATIASHQKFPGLDGESWFGIFATALIPQLIGHTFLNMSLRKFAPHIVSLTTLLEPVFASVLATLIFGEMLSLKMILGAGVLLIGLAIVMIENQSRMADANFLGETVPV